MSQNFKAYFSNTLKLTIIAIIILLLLIPLAMIKGTIREREQTKETVKEEIANATAKDQVISAPKLHYLRTITTNNNNEETHIYEKANRLDFDTKVNVETLRRSIYEILVYNSTIQISGNFIASDSLCNQKFCDLQFKISDFKGLTSIPKLIFFNQEYTFDVIQDDYNNILSTTIKLPEDLQAGDNLDFHIDLEVKGTESIDFIASANHTTLKMESTYPHPSFNGDFLPTKRTITDKGFTAEWSVLGINTSNAANSMAVTFLDPADPYLQAERSTKYGILIIIMVFVAGLLVEFITKKKIHIIQYAVIGLSLALFYALLLAFSEFIIFGLSYLIDDHISTYTLFPWNFKEQSCISFRDFCCSFLRYQLRTITIRKLCFVIWYTYFIYATFHNNVFHAKQQYRERGTTPKRGTSLNKSITINFNRKAPQTGAFLLKNLLKIEIFAFKKVVFLPIIALGLAL